MHRAHIHEARYAHRLINNILQSYQQHLSLFSESPATQKHRLLAKGATIQQDKMPEHNNVTSGFEIMQQLLHCTLHQQTF